MKKIVLLIVTMFMFAASPVPAHAAAHKRVANLAVGQYIDWKGSGDGKRDNLRYRCGGLGEDVLMAKGIDRNLCASKPNERVLIWVPNHYNMDRWNSAPPNHWNAWFRDKTGPGYWTIYEECPGDTVQTPACLVGTRNKAKYQPVGINW